MYININIVTIISIIIILISLINILSVCIGGMNGKKIINGKYILVGVILIIVSTILLIDNIDYNKSIPAEVYTEEDLDGSYQVGYETGLKDGSVDYTVIEDWFSGIVNVTVNTGSENTIHIIDGNGEEWVLVSDNN